MDDMEKWMKDNGIEDVTGDKELELAAAINTDNYFNIEDDHKAIKMIFKVLTAMLSETKMTQYTKLVIDQRMFYLQKYLYERQQQ